MAQANAYLVIEAISNFSPFLPGKVADIAYLQKDIIALTPLKSEVRSVLGPNYPYISKLNNIPNIKNALLRFFKNQSNTINNNDSVIKNVTEYTSVSFNLNVVNNIFI